MLFKNSITESSKTFLDVISNQGLNQTAGLGVKYWRLKLNLLGEQNFSAFNFLFHGGLIELGSVLNIFSLF